MKSLFSQKDYRVTRVAEHPKVKLYTSLKAKYSCAIGGVMVDGMTAGQLADALFEKYKIHVVGVNWENIHTVRITPHVYTTIADLDKLVGAIKTIAG